MRKVMPLPAALAVLTVPVAASAAKAPALTVKRGSSAAADMRRAAITSART
jgi:hypothetical protein